MTFEVVERDIPNLPNSKFVQHNGDLTPEWRIFLEDLRNSVTLIKNTITETTVGGSAIEIINVERITSDDLILAQVRTSTIAGLFVEKSRTLLNQVEITFNADPLNSTEVTFIVIAKQPDNTFI